MRVVIVAAALLLSYLLSAFVAWEFNPGEWSESGRFFTAMLGLLLAIFVASVPKGIYD